MKWAATSTVIEVPAATTRGAIVPTARGARLGTVTSKCWTASSPPGSRAVTATVARPAPTPVTVSVPPSIATATRVVSEEVAAYCSSCPSGSANRLTRSTTTTLSTATSRSAITPTRLGARFGTFTAKDCSAHSPCGSRAVAVTVALPTATAATVTVPPATATHAVISLEDTAPYTSASPSGSLKWGAISTVTVSPT